MSGDNWSAFETSSGSKDDDWGDFGGFESAAPVDSQGESTTSSFIPWAAFAQPMPSVAPSFTSSSNQTVPQVISDLQAAQLTAAFAVPSVPSTASQVLPTNQQASFTVAFPSTANQQAPSITGSEAHGFPRQPMAVTQTSFNAQSLGNSYSEAFNGPPLIASNSSETGGSKLQEKELREAKDAKAAMENKVDVLEKQLTTAEKEKLRMQEELSELLEKSKKMEKQAEELTETLKKQQDKYSKLQEQHQQQIEDIRKGGHNALAIIVEEYKELSRKAVTEQQEQSEIQMQAFLLEERKKFQQIIEEQQARFEVAMTEEREKNARQTQDVLQELNEKHKEEIQSCLQEERQNSQTALLKAVEEAREQGFQAMEKTKQQQKETFDNILEEHKANMLTMVEGERQKSHELVEEAIKRERENNKAALQEALAHEKQKSKEAIRAAVEETKRDMLEYLKEKQQADAACRHRQFIGLDLFLESARSQLQALMNDKDDDTS